MAGSKGFVEAGESDQGLELLLMKSEDIPFATNSFSDSNKLGKGGLGIDYKVKHET